MNKLYYTIHEWSNEFGEYSTVNVFQIENNEPIRVLNFQRDLDWTIKEQIDSELEDLGTDEIFEYILL